MSSFQATDEIRAAGMGVDLKPEETMRSFERIALERRDQKIGLLQLQLRVECEIRDEKISELREDKRKLCLVGFALAFWSLLATFDVIGWFR